MSGKSRMLRKKLGSSCFASICATALSIHSDWAVRNCTKIGTDTLYMETAMELGRLLGVKTDAGSQHSPDELWNGRGTIADGRVPWKQWAGRADLPHAIFYSLRRPSEVDLHNLMPQAGS